MKKLLIDAGNSSIKWSLLDNDQLTKMKSLPYHGDIPIVILKKIIEKQLDTSSLNSIVMVSVLGEEFIEGVNALSAQLLLKIIIVESKHKLCGVTNSYKKVHNLGADRFVAIIAAHNFELGIAHSSKTQATIVVDSGTATTIDAVDHFGQHIGGVILSGLDLCSENLLINTELLPLFNKNKNKNKLEPNIFSTDTTQAIVSGSLFGLSGAISHICVQMEQELSRRLNTKVVTKKFVCGGAAKTLLPHLQGDFLLQENLIMQGLKIISGMKKS